MKKSAAVLLACLISSTISAQFLFDPAIEELFDSTLKPFYFGVASGDPQQHQVLLWTKIGSEENQPILVKWEIATDTTMNTIIQTGEVTTLATTAFTVKIVVKDLNPNSTYFYRFQTNKIYSPIGRTKTAPTQADDLKFAVVSCNNYENGYFNGYRIIAERNDLNAVIHLGDYIYENYRKDKKKAKQAVRHHIPQKEILTLQDYRSRYAQYRLDKDFMEVHRLHPFIAVWDDHEFANNCYKDGAEHQNDSMELWKERKEIGKQVYFEWVPITDSENKSIFRAIQYGNLADLFMIDTRMEDRCKQVGSPYDPELYSEKRTMLGKSQQNWLTAGIENSTARWKVIGNQVLFSEVDAHKLSKKYARFVDSWDGYPAERKVIMDSLYSHNQKNIIVLTGDIHTSWAFDLVQDPQNKNRYNSKTGKGVIGAEFVTPSISSSNLGERLPRGFAQLLGSLMKNSNNPHLKFTNTVDHGFVLLHLNKDKAKATWIYCKTIRERTDKYSQKNSWSTQYNTNKLVKDKAEK